MKRRATRGPQQWFGRADRPEGAGWMVVEDGYGDPLVQAPPPVTEQVRYIVERMRLHGPEQVPGTLGVTSALAGEGADLVARTLAGVLAGDATRRVCLISLDWWTSAVPADQAGIAQVVAGSADAAGVLQQTSIPRLMYVPAGPAEREVLPELARSTGLDRALKELALRFNHVVLELPPVGLTSEALALAGHCDACALVVLQGATSRSEVRAAIDNLGKERVLGVILNRMSTRVPDALVRAVATT